MASDLSIYKRRRKACALSLKPAFLSPGFWVGGWVFWLQAKASSCCDVNTGAFGEEVLNKNIYSGKKSHMKETKALPMCAV